jgi:serine/threonine protein kinase
MTSRLLAKYGHARPNFFSEALNLPQAPVASPIRNDPASPSALQEPTSVTTPSARQGMPRNVSGEMLPMLSTMSNGDPRAPSEAHQFVRYLGDAQDRLTLWWVAAREQFVVIKRIPQTDRWKAECEVKQVKLRCVHPNIIKYYGYYRHINHDVSVEMEFMNVGDLAAVLTQWANRARQRDEAAAGPALPPCPTEAQRLTVARCVGVQTLSGLLYYHKVHRQWHRDIKPGNILLSAEGRVKICDFDTSKRADQSGTQTCIGTAFYMSPEAVTCDAAKISDKRDMWAVGMVLVEVCLGEKPFDEGTAMGAMLRPDELMAKMPWERIPEAGGFQNLVRSCLRVDPDERISCRDALCHPFFADRVGVVRLDEKAVANMKEAVAKMARRGIVIDSGHPDVECIRWRAARDGEPYGAWSTRDRAARPAAADDAEYAAGARERWRAEIDTDMKQLLYNRWKHVVAELRDALKVLQHKGRTPKRPQAAAATEQPVASPSTAAPPSTPPRRE